NIVTNITQTGATTFSTGTGATTLNGDATVVAGKTLTVGGAGGTAIKAIEIGTCTNPGGNVTNWVCSAGAGAVTGITIANLTVTDSITLTGRTTANNVGCFVASITAGTSFTIRCNANPGNGTVYNIMVVRR